MAKKKTARSRTKVLAPSAIRKARVKAAGRGKLSRAEFEKRLKKIRMLMLDVDGVLTAGEIFYTKGQGWTRIYHVHDGYWIRHMLRQGFPIGIISGGQSEELRERIQLLGIEHSVLGSEDKLTSMRAISERTGIPMAQMAYIG